MHNSIVEELHHPSVPVYLDTLVFSGWEWVKSIINAPKATIPLELKHRLQHGHSGLEASSLNRL